MAGSCRAAALVSILRLENDGRQQITDWGFASAVGIRGRSALLESIPDSRRACLQWPDQEQASPSRTPLRGNFRGSRLCQVRLILDDEIIGGKSDVKSRLF